MASDFQLAVSTPPPDDARLLGMDLHQPRRGGGSSNYGIQIVGWVVGRDAPVDRVEVIQGGQIVQAATVEANQPTIAARFPGVAWAARSGFALMLNSLSFEPTFEFDLRAVIDNRAIVPLASFRGERPPLRPAKEQNLQPLIVTSLGRTGTTWLMRLLAEHPEIVAYRRYPYEVRPATYWMHMLRVLSAPADHAKRISHPHGFYADETAIGANPFFAPLHEYPDLQDWLGHTYVEKLAEFCQDCIEDWYRCLMAKQDQPAAKFFAEKHLPNQFPVLLWELYPHAREIFLVRDLRDVASSVLAFNVKRGFDDFGRQSVASDEEYLHQLRHGGVVLLESWRRRAEKSTLVRYEDLVTSPRETLASLFAYVGVDTSAATVAAAIERASRDTSDLQRHQTSESPAASIGRWRRDLDPALRDAASEVFSDVLTNFGYDGSA